MGARGPKPSIPPSVVVEAVLANAREGHSYKFSAKDLNLSRQRVHQILEKEGRLEEYHQIRKQQEALLGRE